MGGAAIWADGRFLPPRGGGAGRGGRPKPNKKAFFREASPEERPANSFAERLRRRLRIPRDIQRRSPGAFLETFQSLAADLQGRGDGLFLPGQL